MTVRDLKKLAIDLDIKVIVYDSGFPRYYDGTIGRIYEEEVLKLRVVGFNIENELLLIKVVKY